MFEFVDGNVPQHVNCRSVFVPVDEVEIDPLEQLLRVILCPSIPSAREIIMRQELGEFS